MRPEGLFVVADGLDVFSVQAELGPECVLELVGFSLERLIRKAAGVHPLPNPKKLSECRGELGLTVEAIQKS